MRNYLDEEENICNQPYLTMSGSEMGSIMQIFIDENDYNGCGEGGESDTIQNSMGNCPDVLLLRCMGWL